MLGRRGTIGFNSFRPGLQDLPGPDWIAGEDEKERGDGDENRARDRDDGRPEHELRPAGRRPAALRGGPPDGLCPSRIIPGVSRRPIELSGPVERGPVGVELGSASRAGFNMRRDPPGLAFGEISAGGEGEKLWD
jgi:hypothetical protein